MACRLDGFAHQAAKTEDKINFSVSYLVLYSPTCLTMNLLLILPFLVPADTSITEGVPAQMTCEVVSYTRIGPNRMHITAVNMIGDTVYLKYGWQGIGTATRIRKGSTMMVEYNPTDCGKDKWLKAKIKLIR
jgi:hypothetical protein